VKRKKLREGAFVSSRDQRSCGDVSFVTVTSKCEVKKQRGVRRRRRKRRAMSGRGQEMGLRGILIGKHEGG